MFKRFWQSINEWADALSRDDPRGDYMFRLEDRVAKLEREVECLQIHSNDAGGIAGRPCPSTAILNAAGSARAQSRSSLLITAQRVSGKLRCS